MREYIDRTLTRLVQINSINPDLVSDAPGEREAAEFVAAEMRTIGCEVKLVGGQRPSVIATLPGSGWGRSLMFNGHIDTVGVAGMPDPFSGRIEGGKLYGRGSYDMKASVVASMAAIRELANRRPAGDVVLTAVADEEFASLGTQEVLKVCRTDAAICTEPTSLKTCLAHKGFVWIEIETTGKAAHGSRPELGIDANMKIGRFLAKLDGLAQALQARQPHPLLGAPSLHASTLRGGSGWSTYSSQCILQVERRTIPGESVDAVLAELQALDPESMRLVLARDSFEVRSDAAIVQAVRKSGGGDFVGDTPWMDAALLSTAGIETVVIGPHGTGAHAEIEWVDLDSTYRLAEILRDTAVSYCV